MSVAEFFSMGGYGAFVWSSFGITLALIVGEIIAVRQQHRTILQRLGRMMRLNAEVEK
jgi:heme exporter protein D